MDIGKDLEDSINNVCSNYNQSEEFANALKKLIENVISDSYTEDDIISLIDRITM